MVTTTPTQDELIELEIAAFMSPHIKRARIALFLVGALFAWLAYRSYGDIAELRRLMKGESGDFKNLVDKAYFLVVFTGFAGVANIVLAAIGGKKPTFAMYTATGIFGVYTLIQLYFTEGGVFFSWLWWLIAIMLGMGFQAAYKAQQLRKSRVPAEARAL